MMRTVALPLVVVCPAFPALSPRERVSPLALPLDPKMSVSLPAELPFGPLLFPLLKNGSFPQPSSVKNVASFCESIAKMMFSLTPFRFRSISRSGSRLKRLARVRMMAITVFSLNPARTSLTTAELVKGKFCCAAAGLRFAPLTSTNRKARPAIENLEKRDLDNGDSSALLNQNPPALTARDGLTGDLTCR